jgi:hypothetical protein
MYLEIYYWAWRLLGLGAGCYLVWYLVRLLWRDIWGPERADDAVARGVLRACRKHWKIGGTVVFRNQDGSTKTLRRC